VVAGRPSEEVVEYLNQNGIRTHTRKADHYSGNVLNPLGMSDCIRISLCHYNSLEEVGRLLELMADLTTPAA
jgi:selenocysteine lyase/cysteine desulfurase